MLRQGPVDKNDGKLNDVRRSETTCGHFHLHTMSTVSTNSWSNDQREVIWGSHGEFHLHKHLASTCKMYKVFLPHSKLQNLSHSTSILPPSPFSEQIHSPTTWTPVQQRWSLTSPTRLKSHKLVHHLVAFYFTVSRPGATDPRAKHQALAPPLPIKLCCRLMSLTLLLTFNALARACGQKRWQN